MRELPSTDYLGKESEVTEFLKLLVGLAAANSKLDTVVVVVKEAVLVVIVAQAILASAEQILRSFLTAAGAQ